ncbi:jg1101 [Pararge aegeria aegeria]|uniref:Jg1101 protein n=1 Tax=Pararge aegeria aegeria TaxID=348720 RepID=A0A8S4SQT6_9NEOP|nr:jg1101 [Pararge aegeria aegeria]
MATVHRLTQRWSTPDEVDRRLQASRWEPLETSGPEPVDFGTPYKRPAVDDNDDIYRKKEAFEMNSENFTELQRLDRLTTEGSGRPSTETRPEKEEEEAMQRSTNT